MAIDALDDAVLNVMLADATLTGLLAGGVYLDAAPENEPTPFAVVTLLNEVTTLQQPAQTAYVTAQYEITVTDRSKTKTAAQAAVDRIDALFNHVTLAPVGFTQMASHRLSRFGQVRREGPELWQDRGCVYEIWASPGVD